MSADEFGIWQAEYNRQPWGEFRIDLAGGMVASVLANVNRDVKAKPVPYTPLDFMLMQREPDAPAPEANPVEFFNSLGAR